MDLFGMAGQLLGNAGGNQNALNAVLSLVNNHEGGLPGLISAFHQSGLGSAVSSWVGTGPNQEVSGEQVQSALGTSQVQEVASKLGVPTEVASGVIAQLLPGIIDHLTPNGQVPSAGSNLMEMGAGLLKNLYK